MNDFDNECEESKEINILRKRKRNLLDEFPEDFMMTNSSENKKINNNVLKILKKNKSSANKENFSFVNSACLEEKSIADIALQKSINQYENTYEVIRKPPKKKKRIHNNIEKSCFVNPGLNLNIPEKKLNPFEVKRPLPVASKKVCFVNQGLNIRTEDNEINFNPFEILRKQIDIDCRPKIGIENPALELPKTLAIALPFTPNINCRINFNDLTPSKLLEKKLVLSPNCIINDNNKSCYEKCSLSTISEEVDIGKELDCYQLELENSINEAKSKKKCEEIKNEKNYQMQIPSSSSSSSEMCSATEIENRIVTDDDSNIIDINDKNDKNLQKEKVLKPSSKINKIHQQEDTKSEVKTSESDDSHAHEGEDEFEYEDEERDDEGDDDDFRKPTPFVRCYRKTVPANTINATATHNGGTMNENEIRKDKKTVKDAIRKSFRNIIHFVGKQQQQQNENDLKDPTKDQHKNANNIHEVIRQSLRIKKSTQNKNAPKVENKHEDNNIGEGSKSKSISVIDITARDIYRSNSVNEIPRDDETFTKMSNFRASLRKSSKCIKNQFYKTLKKTTENYELKN